VTRRSAAPFGAAALSGALLALARPPFDLGPLALVALVPLLWTWRDAARPRRAAALGFVGGIVYYAVLVNWTWYFGAVAIVPLVAVLAAYWAAVGWLVAWLRGAGLRSPFLTAAVWVVGEAVVARFPLGGFSWGEVGYALHALSPARALASWGGVALVSFLAIAANDFLVDLLRTRSRPSTRRAAALALAGLLAVALVLPAFATLTWMHPKTVGNFHVALIQGNDKNRDLTRAELRARYIPAHHFALADTLRGRYDLVVFPESSMDDDPRLDDYLEGNLQMVGQRLGAYVLANAVTDAPDGRAVNLDLLYSPRGRLIGTYAKRHLVPYGEEVPFRKQIEGIIPAVNQIPRDFAPGKKPGLFDVRGHRIATIICFESAFGYQVRPLVQKGAQLIVLSTNNRSYRRSANSAQHVDLSQMRAAETGRPLLQASISGISAVIDAHGNVSHRTKLFVPSIVDARVALTIGETPYVRIGEWVVLGSTAAVVIAVAIGFARRRRRSVDSPAVDDTSAAPPEPAARVNTPSAERV
jgi:apolipoprotein N-acyltransferase